MQCDRCLRTAVIHQPYSGLHLCGHHLSIDVSAKAKRVVRAYGVLRPGDRIAVILTGRKSGYALLHFMHSLLADRRDITLRGIVYTNDCCQLTRAHWMCDEIGIDCTHIPLQEGLPSFAICGASGGQVREQLHHATKELGVTKFVLDWTLDDTALRVFTTLLEGRTTGTGNDEELRFPVITPFMHIPAREVDLLAEMLHPDINGIASGKDWYANSFPGFQGDVKILLDDYCAKHPSTKFAIVNLGETLQYCGLAMYLPADSLQAGIEHRGEP